MGFSRDDDAGLNFDVIAYRGAPVATFDGWRADVKSRGGTVAQVPGGFFHDVKAARFGYAVPYVYELPPIWLLVWDGIDVSVAEFQQWVNYQGIAEEAENQRQSLEDLVTGAGKAGGALVAGLPSLVKWGAIGLTAIVGLELLRTLAPAHNPPRRRRSLRGRPSG